MKIEQKSRQKKSLKKDPNKGGKASHPDAKKKPCREKRSEKVQGSQDRPVKTVKKKFRVKRTENQTEEPANQPTNQRKRKRKKKENEKKNKTKQNKTKPP